MKKCSIKMKTTSQSSFHNKKISRVHTKNFTLALDVLISMFLALKKRIICSHFCPVTCTRDLHQGWESHRCSVQIPTLPSLLGDEEQP